MGSEATQQNPEWHWSIRVLIHFVLLVIASQFNPLQGWFLDFGANAHRVAISNISYNLPPWGIAYALTWIGVIRRQEFFVRVLILLAVYAMFVVIQNPGLG